VKKFRVTYLFTLLLALASCFTLHAQTLTATASKTTVAVGEQIQVDYTANVSINSFSAPSFADFKVQGPYQSSSMQSINGVSSQSITLSYVLVPTKEGTFTIGAGTAKSGGKTLTSNGFTIIVTKASPQAQASKTQQSNNSSEGSLSDKQLKQNLFVRLTPSRTKVYQGEAIPVTVKIYTRMDLQGLQDVNFPDYNGFFTEDVPEKPQNGAAREIVNGVTYGVVTLKENVIFPEHPGKLTIGPVEAKCVVQERVQSHDPNDIFAQFFGTYKRAVYTIKSDPVVIDVMPLPNTDKEFSGAVGHYTVKGTLDKSNVKANDAVNLNVTITGDGELKLIDSIPIKFPPDFDHYDPKITNKVNVSTSGVSGSRNYSYVVIPRHQGSYKIPPVDFTYFDPSKKSYVTLTIPEMNLDVAKGDNTGATQMNNPVTTTNKEDIKVLGSDIRFIHTGHMPSYELNNFFLFSLPFFAGLAFPLLCFVGFLFVRRRYIELNKDAVSVKQRGATRMAKKRLKTAEGFIASGNKESFYEEVHKAVNTYLADKFTIAVADLSRDTIIKRLTEKKVSPETIQQLSAVLDDCEYARYAPASVTGDLQSVYDSTVTLITKLEDEISV